jgi:exodeoxyribonuclease VII large subunit
MLEDPALARQSERSAAPILSVSALNRSVRDLLEHRFPLVWVAGEISNLTQARSGHLYFSLKDAQAQIRCVMFRSRTSLLEWQPRDGMHVEALAAITLYEARGEFQLNVDAMRRAGVGALYEAFVRLRDRLEREGLFDPASKRALPRFPRAIGVATSLAAAALHDVLKTLSRRNPAIPVIVYRTSVQGEQAPAEIVTALRRAARRQECDVLILCRGGGSLEDLRAFNDERVARAIRASPIPIVVGVGHETDFTIADFAADLRAPTPTAAAELASPARSALLERLAHLAMQLHRCGRRGVEMRMQHLDHVARRLVHPGKALQAQQAMVRQLASRLDYAFVRSTERRRWRLRSMLERASRHRPPIDACARCVATLAQAIDVYVERMLVRQRARVDPLAASLAALDPHAVLARGFSIVRDAEGRVVRAATQVARGDVVDIAFAEGSASARIERSRTS